MSKVTQFTAVCDGLLKEAEYLVNSSFFATATGMEDNEHKRELARKFNKGVIKKKEFDRRMQQCEEDRKRERQVDRRQCLKKLIQCICCCYCANLCFRDKDDNWKKYFCASSLICMLSGGMTTLISSGVFQRSCFSCLGLEIGIPVSVLGCLCATGLCACKSEKCPCSRKKKKRDSSSTASLDRVVDTQPGQARRCQCSDDDDNYAEADSLL